jgi:hypothetical protein
VRRAAGYTLGRVAYGQTACPDKRVKKGFEGMTGTAFGGVPMPVYFVDFGDVLVNFTGKPYHKPLLFLSGSFYHENRAFSIPGSSFYEKN